MFVSFDAKIEPDSPTRADPLWQPPNATLNATNIPTSCSVGPHRPGFAENATQDIFMNNGERESRLFIIWRLFMISSNAILAWILQISHSGNVSIQFFS